MGMNSLERCLERGQPSKVTFDLWNEIVNDACHLGAKGFPLHWNAEMILENLIGHSCETRLACFLLFFSLRHSSMLLSQGEVHMSLAVASGLSWEMETAAQSPKRASTLCWHKGSPSNRALCDGPQES